MTVSQEQSGQPIASRIDQPILSERLRVRLEALGITVASVAPDGWVTVHGISRWVERLITDSPQFAHTVKQNLRLLCEKPGQPAAIWPGVWLVPLQAQRFRQLAHDTCDEAPLLVAILLTEEFLSSEWLSLLCDTLQVDRQMALTRISTADMVRPDEIDRLGAMLCWMQQDVAEIDRRHNELRTMSQQLGNSYEELSLLYKLSTHMNVNHSSAEFLSDACKELHQVLGLRWVALQLADDEPRLNGLSGQIYNAGYTGSDADLIQRFGKILMLQHYGDIQPLIIEDTGTMGIPHIERLAKQLVVVSLVRDGMPFGVLFGGDKLNGSSITSADAKLCNTLANSLSIFLQNVVLYDDMQTMFLGILHALTNSIDAKDSYTHGHSERVALMAKLLAQAAGLDADRVERVYISGLVHDVGKIGVPEAILCKPGRLTDSEFDLVKRHPEIGAHILSNIRQMQDLIPGVLYHHERWDGRGYPHQLAAEDIPLYGRLIGLADSFDAMSSNRSYRAAMSHDTVLAEIRRCSGEQFDPGLAELFVQLDFSPFFELLQKHMTQAQATE